MPPLLTLFFCVVAGGAAVALPLSLRKSKVALLFWLALYLGSYAILSEHGQYVPNGSPSRGLTQSWYPAYCGDSRIIGVREQPYLNPIGYFYLPLVGFDRLVLHNKSRI